MELRDRLRRALGPGAVGAPQPPATRLPRTANLDRTMAALPGLRALESEGGTVYFTEQTWPLAHAHGHRRLGETLGLDAAALTRFAPDIDSDALAGAAYVDVGTTGLAGGTGTYVFLVGVGTFDDDTYRIRQYFLADLAGERSMLAAVNEAIAERSALVSFNGRRFDLPMIVTRLTLNRLRAPPDMPHIDLLYPARRLYQRRLPSCRLGVLEEELLGVTREDDVPGWLVPSLYFDYMRTGRAEPLRGVFRHNALDILSLVTLLSHLGHVAGGTTPGDADDYVALGRWDESEGRLVGAAAAYAAALELSDDGEAHSTARWRLAYLHRRANRLAEAAQLWREEVEAGGPLERRLGAMVEVAKLEEHRWRRYGEAEAVTRRALALLDVATQRRAAYLPPELRREALEHRLGRLGRRLARERAGQAADSPRRAE